MFLHAVCLLLVTPFVNACTFCPEGTPLPDPDQVIQLPASTQTTCGELEEEASNDYMVQAYGCNYYRYYAKICGCPEPRNPLQVCELCQNGGEDVDESATVNEQTCGEIQLEARFDPFRRGCGYYLFLGARCGCQGNSPPSDGCQLCADGTDPLYSALPVRVPGVEEGTCQHVQEYTQYVRSSGSHECISSQSTLGEYCGCNQAVQPPNPCPICLDENLYVSNDRAPDFSYLSQNGKTMIHHSGKLCLEAELLANEITLDSEVEVDVRNEQDGTTCATIRSQIAEACCQEATTITEGSGTPPQEEDQSAASTSTNILKSTMVVLTMTFFWYFTN